MLATLLVKFEVRLADLDVKKMAQPITSRAQFQLKPQNKNANLQMLLAYFLGSTEATFPPLRQSQASQLTHLAPRARAHGAHYTAAGRVLTAKSWVLESVWR